MSSPAKFVNARPAVTPSLLDRLVPTRVLEQDPELADTVLSGDSVLLWSIAAERQAVRLDLEDLLNTRVAPQLTRKLSARLGLSLLAYGLPELSDLSAYDEAEHAALCAAVRCAVETFEPRLLLREVAFIGASRRAWQLQLRIVADLRLEPGVERIVFDATLPIINRRFEVKERLPNAR